MTTQMIQRTIQYMNPSPRGIISQMKTTIPTQKWPI